jgi:predicted DNA-binding protein (MmcQ/YjbR family)
MNIEEFRDYCIAKPGVTESFPFDETTLVFKVMGKMFALTDTEDDFAINLKCDPERAVSLRSQYPAVIPGYHMNKQHWNTIRIDGSMNDDFLYELVNHSYDLIVKSLTKAKKEELKAIISNEEIQ